MRPRRKPSEVHGVAGMNRFWRLQMTILVLLLALLGILAFDVPHSSAQICPLGQGFWKTHPKEWKVSGLTLGTRLYTNTELLKILHTPVRGDASIILAHQLIAALLNIANGSDPSSVRATVLDANSALG